MQIDTYELYGYKIIRIERDPKYEEEFVKLKEVFTKINTEGDRVALSCGKGTNFYSRTIAVIVQFLGMAKEHDGSFAIIHPNPDKLNLITLVGLDRLIPLFTDESQLGSESLPRKRQPASDTLSAPDEQPPVYRGTIIDDDED